MRKRSFDLIITGVSAVLLGYLAWHGFDGARGFPFHDRMTAEAKQLSDELAMNRQHRETLELKVAHLRPQTLDQDLLDEMARTMLGLNRPEEFVVLRNLQKSEINP